MIIDCSFSQGDEAWRLARLGRVTASNMHRILSPTGKISDQRHAYMCELLAEHFSGRTKESYTSDWMQRGNEEEGPAVSVYEMIKDVETVKVGIVYKDDKKLVACSPDRMMGLKINHLYHDDGSHIPYPESVGEVGGLEAKNPAPHTHISYLLNGGLPTKYYTQLQGSMWVTGLDKWDFISNCEGLKPLILTVHRDDEYIDKLEQEVEDFINQMLEKREKLK